MRAIREKQRVATNALAGLAAACALLAATAPGAAAAPAATVTPTSNCWLQVVNDWLRHNPEIKNLYPIPCYTQAIQKLNEYPDLKQYSSAIDDIQRALLAAIHEERGSGPGGGPSSNGGGGGGGGGSSQTPPRSGGGSTSPTSSGGGGGSQSPIANLFHPSNAQSIPLPLIVLAGLAVLLLLAGGGTWLAKRLQARRMTPAPAPPQPR
jgi:hypothetical protein